MKIKNNKDSSILVDNFLQDMNIKQPLITKQTVNDEYRNEKKKKTEPVPIPVFAILKSCAESPTDSDSGSSGSSVESMHVSDHVNNALERRRQGSLYT